MTRKLLSLLRENRGQGFFKIVEGGSGELDGAEKDTATLYVYDAIGPGAIEAESTIKAVAAINANNIYLRINSPGGDVFDARAIKTALERHPAKVTAFVDGLAASAASFLMLAASDIQIAPGAFIMIHNPWGFAMGDAREMRATAALLDQVGTAIRNDYTSRTGLDAQTIAKMMDAETWMDADTAVAKRFCSSLIVKPAKANNLASPKFNLCAYANLPRALAANSREKAQAPVASSSAFDLESKRRALVVHLAALG